MSGPIDVFPALFPPDTPPDIEANTITTRRSTDQAVIECAICREVGYCVEFRAVLTDGYPDRECVQRIAKHLFLVHNVMCLAKMARGE